MCPLSASHLSLAPAGGAAVCPRLRGADAVMPPPRLALGLWAAASWPGPSRCSCPQSHSPMSRAGLGCPAARCLPMGCAHRRVFLAHFWLCGDPPRADEPPGLAVMREGLLAVWLVGVLWERRLTWGALLHPRAELGQRCLGSPVPTQPVPETSCCCLQLQKINS